MIHFRSPHFTLAYRDILKAFTDSSLKSSPTRDGPALDLGAATLQLEEGGNRWCLIKERGLDPFLAIQEMLAILSGPNSVAGLAYYARQYRRFSDDGRTLNGAYGFRLRRHFGFNQVAKAVTLLRQDSSTRRVCLALWDAHDLVRVSKDLPCNVLVNLKIRNSKLDITVFNRSNDAFLGLPYNVLQFAALQAYVAGQIPIEIGSQFHFIDSLHLYEKHFETAKRIVRSETKSQLQTRLMETPKSSMQQFAALDHQRLVSKYRRNVGGTNEFLRLRNIYPRIRTCPSWELISSLPESEIGILARWWLENRLKRLHRS